MKTLLFLALGASLLAHSDTVNVKADETVCLPSKVCVAVSVLESEFAGYEAGQPAPRLLFQQELIDANRNYAAELEQKSALQGQIGPLQAQVNALRLKAAQDALDVELSAACGKDLAWDKQQRRCLSKKKDGGE